MKSKVLIPEPPVVYEFPLFAKANNGLIVLFTDKQKGTVVDSGASKLTIGYYLCTWIPVTDDHWTILPKGSTVILTQE